MLKKVNLGTIHVISGSRWTWVPTSSRHPSQVKQHKSETGRYFKFLAESKHYRTQLTQDNLVLVPWPFSQVKWWSFSVMDVLHWYGWGHYFWLAACISWRELGAPCACHQDTDSLVLCIWQDKLCQISPSLWWRIHKRMRPSEMVAFLCRCQVITLLVVFR